ncbi:dimethyladenosine transferase [Cystoisospora suis]|uniref:rRNA adenine N(6)-methyltransferase n=1 Tax=Cystoisospora suis TaxID=483139 RepID=A0A2C6KYK2_9APIC|nr:dimethyladenosine transferase [Cystoisospora suis]
MPLQKKFGQHLLKNPAVLDKIVQAGDIRSSDTVLEIGPGTGNLTMRLLPVAREVVALDVDARMVSEVKKRAVSNGYMNLTVRQGDALRSDLGTFDVCAANLPYQISSHFLLRLLAHRPPFRCVRLSCGLLALPGKVIDLRPREGGLKKPGKGEETEKERFVSLSSVRDSGYFYALRGVRMMIARGNDGSWCAVLMFQKEFGERLMAQPGDKNYCRLAANVSLFCTVHRVCKVEAKHFTPPPKVDSVVVKIIPRPKLLQLDFKEWDGLMRICFGRKNRTLHALFRRSSVLSMLESNYKTWCTLNKQVPTSSPFREYCLGVLTETGLENRRSISIDIDTYFKLLLAFNKKGIHFVNVASLPGASSVGTSGGAEPMAGIDEYFFYDEDDKGHADGGDDD